MKSVQIKSDKGFTLLELLVSTALLATLSMLVVGFAIGLQESFFQDVVRTRINSNLRSSLDIIGMNIRQTGENLQESFPAVLLEDSDGTTSDRLTLRRNLIPEVLTVCEDFTSGNTSIKLSISGALTPECVKSNVTSMHAAFQTERSNRGGSIPIFMFNSLTKEGEFLEYTTEGLTGDEYYLTVSAPENSYPANTSYVYALEEYIFQHDPTKQSLEVMRDGDDQAEAVAFSISNFTVSIRMGDTSTMNSLDTSDTNTWKDIRRVIITLTGSEERKTRTFSTTVTGEYFPRNILSY